MELFSWKAVEEANKVGILAMPSYSIVRKIKKDKVAFLLEKNIQYIAVSRNFLKKNTSFFNKLRENEIKTFAFHINSKKEFDERYMVCNEMNVFYGIYADNWDFHSEFDYKDCTNK